MAATINDPIARLRHFLREPCEEDAVWLAAAVDAAVAGAPFEEALGLYPGWRTEALGLYPGWRTAHRMRQQEVLIRELLDRFGPMSSGEIASKIDHFACGSQKWNPGSIEELLFYIVRAGKPPSARTVRRMLKAGHPVCGGGQPVALSS
jgi:hypothetical protein